MKLFVYDHCPYCVKARMIFGFKQLPFELITLLNDDEDTPIRMIGQKMVPILEKDDGSFMPESMDIIDYIDGNFGRRILQTPPINFQLNQWLSSIREVLYPLVMPRWAKAPLEEFATETARNYFIRKKEASIGNFEENLAKTPALKLRTENYLLQLNGMIKSENAISGVLSADDIHLFATLRSLSIVKDLKFPSVVAHYMESVATASGIPLHTDIAL